ncbi:MAG TPA: Clp protease N-terminal domain-containing protein [Drouetiella sp.]
MFERIRSLFSVKEAIFDCFTSEALAVVKIAGDEARSMRHNFVGTEHILLGLIAENQGRAAQMLTQHGVDLGTARVEVAKIWGEGRQRIVGELPFTPSAKRLLESAIAQSKRLGVNYVGTEHLLLGMIEPGRGVALKVLNNLGVTRDQVTNALSK